MMINLKILPAVEISLPANLFILYCEAGFGDADGSKIVTVGSFANSDAGLQDLESAIRTCERMKAKYPYGVGGDDNYEDVEGFSHWFMDGENWPNDPFTDYQFSASFKSYKVVYFDKNSIEHPVEVKLS